MSFGLEVFDHTGKRIVDVTSNTLVSIPRGVITLTANGYTTARSSPIQGSGDLYFRVVHYAASGKAGLKGGSVSLGLSGRVLELVNGIQQTVTLKIAIIERV